jgi:hypothetical protein
MKIDELRKLPLGQMGLIVKLYNSPKKRAFVEGKSQGTYIKQLSEKGWVIPAGTIKRRVRWELKKEFSQSEIELMKDLLN